jgi:hypothetical protein
MKPARPSSGFSLVETLVALVLFLMAISMLAQAANNALVNLNIMEVKEGNENDYAFVRQQVETISDTQTLGDGGDVMTPDAGNGHWDAVTATTNTPDIINLQLTIALAGDGDVPAETSNITMLLLRPQMADTDQRATLMSQIHTNLASARTQQVWP